ncbi:MAG: nitroreductase family protein [Spirochaetia bacterium]|jgi:nitroreductase
MKSLDPIRFIGALKGLLDGKVEIPESLVDNPLLKVLLNRRSVRSFQKKDIPDDVFRVILEAGRLAPSTVNLQSWSFGVFDQESWLRSFEKPMPFKGNKALMITGDLHRLRLALDEFPFKPLVEYTLGVINASIAAYAMNVAAEACGVGSVMLSETGESGFYDAQYLKERLGLPDGVFPIMTIVFGYPAARPKGMPPKLALSEITFAGRYKEPDAKATKRWLDQMMAGYRALYVTKSFQGQLKHYLSKSDRAEAGLHKLIFYKKEESLASSPHRKRGAARVPREPSRHGGVSK